MPSRGPTAPNSHSNPSPLPVAVAAAGPAASAVAGAAAFPRWVFGLVAAACGLTVANVYYAQPLVALIAPSIGIAPHAASLIVTVVQLGYCAGLVLLVPLGDRVENRRLAVSMLVVAAAALALAAIARSAPLFLAAAVAIGAASVVVQVLVPLASHMAPAATRGRVVGNVVSGLLVGIMLARPVASLVADAFGWRAVFGASSALMLLQAVALRRWLPGRRPPRGPGYLALLGTLGPLLRATPLLQRRAAYQALLFASFTLYWTAAPLLLQGPGFGFTQRDIAAFALVGAAGAIAAPIAGRLADRGHMNGVTLGAFATAAFAFALSWAYGATSLAALVATGVLVDFAVQANLVVGQRALYLLDAAQRSRLNGLYMTIFFAGGAAGSALASFALAQGGWRGVSTFGLAFALAGVLLHAVLERTERAGR